METKKKEKTIKILTIIVIALAITFAIVTSIVLNSIKKKYDDLYEKNESLSQINYEIID